MHYSRGRQWRSIWRISTAPRLTPTSSFLVSRNITLRSLSPSPSILFFLAISFPVLPLRPLSSLSPRQSAQQTPLASGRKHRCLALPAIHGRKAHSVTVKMSLSLARSLPPSLPPSLDLSLSATIMTHVIPILVRERQPSRHQRVSLHRSVPKPSGAVSAVRAPSLHSVPSGFFLRPPLSLPPSAIVLSLPRIFLSVSVPRCVAVVVSPSLCLWSLSTSLLVFDLIKLVQHKSL